MRLKTNVIPAESLAAGIVDAAKDEAMAASLERVHSIYTDREEPPVKKVQQ